MGKATSGQDNAPESAVGRTAARVRGEETSKHPKSGNGDGKKRGLILNNAYLETEHGLYQSGRIKEELERLGAEVDVLANDSFLAAIDEAGSVVSRAAGYDFCVYLDKDKYMSLLLEKAGVRLFDRHSAVEACDDKMTTAILLADRGIPMPTTLPGLLCFDPRARVRDETLDEVGRRLGYPLVMKTAYGSLGAGVFLIEDREALRAKTEELKCSAHLYQRFVATSAGRDVRAIVIGKKFFAAMKRQSDGDFRSNLELGGTGEPFALPRETEAMCEKVAEILDLDYCGIDLLFGESGFLVCEVNSNAYFGGFERVTGKNVARAFAEHILRSLVRGE